MKNNKLNTEDFLKSLTENELIEWEDTFKYHLSLTTKHKIGDAYLTTSELNKMHKKANKNLELIKNIRTNIK